MQLIKKLTGQTKVDMLSVDTWAIVKNSDLFLFI